MYVNDLSTTSMYASQLKPDKFPDRPVNEYWGWVEPRHKMLPATDGGAGFLRS